MNGRHIKKAMDALVACDDDIAAAFSVVGYPKARKRPQGFEAFLTAIISQQISNRAAATIRERVFACLGEISAAQLLKTSETSLREAGMSQRKVEYARGLASAIADKNFDPDALEKMTDEEAIEAITALRGFGVWTAEMYLMFSLGRQDIFPIDDLIIRNALHVLKRKRKPLTSKSARALTKHWAPYRSTASLFLWHWYQHELGPMNSKKK